jgi:hypothetical protein
MNKTRIFLSIILLTNFLFSQNDNVIISTLQNQNLDRIDSIAKKLNLKGGDIIRVQTVFSVDKDGNIFDIHVRSPYKLFEDEAIKLIRMIPKLDPPKNLDGEEKISFSLPIKFVIESDKSKEKRRKKEKRKREKDEKKHEKNTN